MYILDISQPNLMRIRICMHIHIPQIYISYMYQKYLWHMGDQQNHVHGLKTESIATGTNRSLLVSPPRLRLHFTVTIWDSDFLKLSRPRILKTGKLSKPNPNSTQLNSTQLYVTRVEVRHSSNVFHPPTQTFQPLLDKLGSWKKLIRVFAAQRFKLWASRRVRPSFLMSWVPMAYRKRI